MEIASSTARRSEFGRGAATWPRRYRNVLLLCLGCLSSSIPCLAQQNPAVEQSLAPAASQENSPQAPGQDPQSTAPANPEPPPKKKKKLGGRGAFVVAPLPISSPAIGSGIVPVLGYIFPFSKNDKVSPPSTIGAAGLITDNGSRGFAIGGHCQILLTMDYILAASDAFMTLPARKEGIIPGAANLRLPRFTGDRIARQAIQYERKLVCDSPEGRLICDEIAAPADMDNALQRVIDGLTNSGAVSATSNRRAIRIGEEPLDAFRQYFSAYARDQAYCHFSPALIANLEREWNAHNRKI